MPKASTRKLAIRRYQGPSRNLPGQSEQIKEIEIEKGKKKSKEKRENLKKKYAERCNYNRLVPIQIRWIDQR